MSGCSFYPNYAIHHELIHASIRVAEKCGEGGGVKGQKQRGGVVKVEAWGHGEVLHVQPKWAQKQIQKNKHKYVSIIYTLVCKRMKTNVWTNECV